MIEQPLLAAQTAAITGQRPIGTDDSVTRHDDRDRIGAICPPNRAHGVGLIDPRGKARIAQGLAHRNGSEGRPDPALKRRAVRGPAYLVESLKVTGKIAGYGV